MSNPVLSQYSNGVSYSGFSGGLNSTLTMDSVMSKALIQFTLLIVSALAAVKFLPDPTLNLATFGSMAITLILSFVIAKFAKPNVPLILLYSIFEGIFVGGVSSSYANIYHGIIPIAVISTTATALAIILGMRMGFLRTTGRMRQIFFYMVIGYLIFSLAVIALSFAGVHLLNLGSPFAIAVSIFGVAMSCFSFLTDVENINNALGSNIPENESWRLGFGLVVSLVWLYLEIVRLIANIAQASR